MRYELMFPDQIRQAIEANWPVVLPLGVLEYHAEHLTVGTDGLLPVRAFEILEKEMDLIILPPFYYCAASFAVEPPERKGTIQVDSSVLHLFGRQLFNSLLRIGFRNIHCFVHHQSENFFNGMPTDLAFRLAARQIIFEFLEKERGEGWWGKNEMADYYQKHEKQASPFQWIQVHPFVEVELKKKITGDHAGHNETALMMAFCPEGMDMKRYSSEKWYAQAAAKADPEFGRKAKAEILASLRNVLKN